MIKTVEKLREMLASGYRVRWTADGYKLVSAAGPSMRIAIDVMRSDWFVNEYVRPLRDRLESK